MTFFRWWGGKGEGVVNEFMQCTGLVRTENKLFCQRHDDR